MGWNEAEYGVDAAYRVLSQAGVDASVLGNHDVDRGYAMSALSLCMDAAFPVLSSNIHQSKYLTPDILPPAIIGLAKGLRIGVIGTTTQEETRIRTKEDPTVYVGDPLAGVQYLVPLMNDLVDVFILLTHLGNEGESRHRVPVGGQSIAALVGKLSSKPALVLDGHTHSILNKDGFEPCNLIGGIPVAQSGSYGQFLGKVDLSLAPSTSGNYSVAGLTVEFIPIKTRDDRVGEDSPYYGDFEHDGDYDAAFEKSTVSPLLQTLAGKMEEPLAEASADIEFSSTRVLESRYVGECGMANFINDLVVARSAFFPVGDSVDFAAFNASGIIGGVEPFSTVSFGDWFAVMPYADNIVVVELTGRHILRILESNARRLVRPEELQGPKPIDLSGFISRGFLHFSSGIRYGIVLGNDPSEAWVSDVSLHGKPITEVLDREYRMAFSSYVASGFEGWKSVSIGAGLPDSILGWDLAYLPAHDTGLVYRNEIIAAIRSEGRIQAPNDNPSLLDGRVKVMP